MRGHTQPSHPPALSCLAAAHWARGQRMMPAWVRLRRCCSKAGEKKKQLQVSWRRTSVRKHRPPARAASFLQNERGHLDRDPRRSQRDRLAAEKHAGYAPALLAVGVACSKRTMEESEEVAGGWRTTTDRVVRERRGLLRPDRLLEHTGHHPLVLHACTRAPT
ncbi:uncharacterized protein A4U43_C01F31370 [Asparagus officinalis]|uniref:Uncharacterized protein n=1 Tax=Asparagus officinalis TaxID=4686 RepID=A0A5P1FWH9_ASPOF|nr:uncharacterized protein A4U43_C01F31370 [Asparagus officinalis]